MHPETRKVLKEQLKSLAKDLHVSKKDLREHMKAQTYKVEEQWHIHKTRKEYRHMHVAYCMARGRKLEEVENKVCSDNPLNDTLVQEFLSTFKQMDTENDEKFPKIVRVEQQQAQ